MLLDDSLEIEAIPLSNDTKLVPMIKWQDIQLSKIWIPSELLLNRQCLSQTSSNVHQSVICRTLEKHNVIDSLSIYPATEIKNSSEKLLDSLEELSPQYLNAEHAYLQKNNEEETHSGLELPTSCSNSTESGLIVDVDSIKNDAYLEEKCDSPDNSIADYLEHLYVSDDDSLIEFNNEPDKPETLISSLNCSNDAEVYETSGAEIPTELVCDMSVKMNICPLNNEVVQDTITMSLNSINDENLTNLVGDMPVKTDTCHPIKEVVQDSLQSSFSSSDQMDDIFDMSEKLWNDHELKVENSCVEEGGLILSNQTVEIDDISGDLHKTANCPEENTEVQLFPFLLQKPKDEDFSTVTKSGKSIKKKRVKKKSSKVIPLDNFFLNKEEATSDSEFLLFYESLCEKRDYQDTSKTSNFKPFSPSSIEFSTIEEDRYPDNSLISTTNLSSSSSLNYTVDSTFVDTSSTKYTVENIPLFVDEEMFCSFIATFGDNIIKNVVMKQSGESLKAIIEVNLEDPNWLIECLNESQPFGASDKCLKCYQI